MVDSEVTTEEELTMTAVDLEVTNADEELRGTAID